MQYLIIIYHVVQRVMNIWCRPLGRVISRLCEYFNAFSIEAYVKQVTPRMGPFLAKGHTLNKSGGGVYYMILNIT